MGWCCAGPVPCRCGALCGEGRVAAGVLGAGLCCGCGFIGFPTMELTCGGVPLLGRGFVAFGFGGMCLISVSWLGVALWGGSCWASLGAHGVGIGTHWGVGTVSSCGGSAWQAALNHRHQPVIVSAASGMLYMYKEIHFG
ncbi:hypothetical protein AMECASPLE_038889 [Ameca splendens]|uniref:Uncharacterized protein n=1 Tax=Ameca splendens TaxID=208324 RepID=A0ABV0ZVA7_9TELE